MEHYGNAFIFLSALDANKIIQKSSPYAFYRKQTNKQTTLQNGNHQQIEVWKKNRFYL